jgi:hypothetical protein
VEERIAWEDLPVALKLAIETRTGPITGVRIVATGHNSPLAAIIDARSGTVFAKGLPSSHRRVITQAREAAVAPLVTKSPRLCCGTSTRLGGMSWATSTRQAVTPTTPLAPRILTGRSSLWRR